AAAGRPTTAAARHRPPSIVPLADGRGNHGNPSLAAGRGRRRPLPSPSPPAGGGHSPPTTAIVGNWRQKAAFFGVRELAPALAKGACSRRISRRFCITRPASVAE